jgi:Flp pilus assembly protein TadG
MICTNSQRRNGTRSGTASIEFAILAPVLVAILFGGVNYGMFVAQSSFLAAATFTGSLYGTRCYNSNSLGVCQTATGKFVEYYTTFPGISTASVVPSPTYSCTCADNTWPSGTTCPPSGPVLTAASGAVAWCNGKLNAFGQPDARVFVYSSVTTSVSNYKPLFNFQYFGASSLSASSALRAQ